MSTPSFDEEPSTQILKTVTRKIPKNLWSKYNIGAKHNVQTSNLNTPGGFPEFGTSMGQIARTYLTKIKQNNY